MPVSASAAERETIKRVAIPNALELPVPRMEPIRLVSYYEGFETYYPSAELQTKAWFAEHIQSDWTILDVGANIGYYTVLFARLAPRGHVVAVEPTDTIEMLRENLAANHLGANITLEKVAMGASTGTFKDRVYKVWGNDPLHERFAFVTLDDYVRTQGLSVQAIKIDVDSYDFEVLKGARQTLLEQNPWVIVELNHALALRQGTEPGDVLRWMGELGYVKATVLDRVNYLFHREEAVNELDPVYRRSPRIVLEWT